MLTQVLSHPVISIVVLLGVLVFIHELGHFLFAKLFGVGVEVFSIGFGPVLFSFKLYGTLYQLAALPLGGFVKIVGQDPGASVPEEYKGQELFRTSAWQRFLILFAGPAFNFGLAVFIYMMMSLGGIEKFESVIGVTRSDSPAAMAGLLPGDRVLKVSGQEIKTWDEMSLLIAESPGKPLALEVKRGLDTLTLSVVPEVYSTFSHKGGKKEIGRIGIAPIFWAPIVTVDKGSRAFNQGLRTGDKILSWSHSQDSRLKSGSIETWHNFESLGNKFAHKSLEAFTLEIQRGQDVKKTLKIELQIPQEALNTGHTGGDFWGTHLGIHPSSLTFVKEPGSSFHESLQNHDRLIAINGKEVRDIFDFSDMTGENEQEEVMVKVSRGGVVKEFSVKLEAVERQMPSGKKLFYHFNLPFLGEAKALPTVLEKSEGLFSAFVFGAKKTYDVSVMMLESVAGLVMGQVPLGSLGGPMAIAKVASDSAKLGLEAFFVMMAVISINLGIVNLLPIPLLDGGRILMLLVEAVLRRPLSLEAVENFHKLGFVFIFSLFILSTYNDLSRFWTSLIREFLGIFE